jgi:hypothetical protein
MTCQQSLDGTPVEASEVCNRISVAEGNGTYTQKNKNTSAAGRYQFVTGTAASVIQKIGAASNEAAAKNIWYNCRQSSTEDCKKLQDKMCNHYSSQIIKQLKRYNIEPTVENIYLAWNQGAGGAKLIWQSIKTGQPVTNKNVLKNMKGQAWKFSSDGRTYYQNMVNYLKKKKVNLTS